MIKQAVSSVSFVQNSKQIEMQVMSKAATEKLF